MAARRASFLTLGNETQKVGGVRAGSETAEGAAQAFRVESASPLRTSTMVADGPQQRRGTALLRPMGHRGNNRTREEDHPGAGLVGFCAATTLTSAGGARCWLSWRTSLAALQAPFLSSKTGTVALRSIAKYRLLLGCLGVLPSCQHHSSTSNSRDRHTLLLPSVGCQFAEKYGVMPWRVVYILQQVLLYIAC